MLTATHRLYFLRRPSHGVSEMHCCCANSMLTATLYASRRFARPTFAEVTEDINILGVSLDMPPAELKKKYRDLVRKHHPDAGGDEKTMSKITVAYDRLSSLSNREKEEFKAQRNAYRGGSGSFGRSGSSSGSSNYAAGGFYSQQAQRTYAGKHQRPAYDTSAGGSSAHGWGQDGADFSREYARANGRASYHQQRGGPQSYSENPFRNHDTVNLNRAFKHFVRMPMNSLLIRGLVVYMIVSVFFAVIYRRYREWRHEEGWKASESLARHEQLERLHQLRQDLQDRVEKSRDGRNTKRWEDFEKARELRVQEYAQKRQLDAQAQEAELSSWPRFEDTQGSLVKRPYDPPGITYFEPGAANERKRQVSLAYGESRRERMKRELENAEAAGMAGSSPSSSSPPLQQGQGPVIVRAGPDGSMHIDGQQQQQNQSPMIMRSNSFPNPPPESASGVRGYVSSSRAVSPQEQNTLENVITTILRGPGAPQRS